MLEDCIRDMELQYKHQEWTNYINNHTCKYFHIVAAVDFQQQLNHGSYPIAFSNWFFDFRANTHMIGNRDLLTDVRPALLSNVTTANGSFLLIIAHGIVVINKSKRINQVMFIPVLCKNLLFDGKLAKDGHYTLFGPWKC